MHSLPYYLPIVRVRVVGFIPSQKGISATWNANSLIQDMNLSTYDDDNRYTTSVIQWQILAVVFWVPAEHYTLNKLD